MLSIIDVLVEGSVSIYVEYYFYGTSQKLAA